MASLTPDRYFTPLKGQSLLYPGKDPKYTGQCVQSVELWLRDTGTPPPSYGFAYQYYDRGISGYTKIPAGPAIKTGDIIVWGANFPSSSGAGHIDVAAANGTVNDFYAWDSNWTPPLKLDRIHHNGNDNKYIVGYLRSNEGEDMGLTKEQIMVIYELAFDDEDKDVPQDIIAAYTGGSLDGLLTQLHQDPSWLAHKAAVAAGGGPVTKDTVVSYIQDHLS